jgi:hypothetical protein
MRTTRNPSFLDNMNSNLASAFKDVLHVISSSIFKLYINPKKKEAGWAVSDIS